jgi:Protein of unknown function (DUF2505)
VRIEVPLAYPAPPSAVWAMLVDPAYQQHKCEAQDARAVHVTVASDGAGTVVTTDRVMSVDGAPDVIRAMVPSGLRVVETLTWPGTGARADVAVHFPRHPLQMRGILRLAEANGAASGVLEADLRARVPMVGARVERMAARLILRSVDTEATVGRDWLRALR